MEGSGLDFGGPRARFKRVLGPQVAPEWPQGLQIPCKMVSKTTVFGRSNLNAKNFDFGMHPFAFPQKAWPRLGGGGVPPWGPSMEFRYITSFVFLLYGLFTTCVEYCHTMNFFINWSTSELNTQVNPTTCLCATGCGIQQVTAPTLVVGQGGFLFPPRGRYK